LINKVILLVLVFGLSIAGCAKNNQVPKTAYDPALLEAAQAAEQERKEEETVLEKQSVQQQEAECSREGGGCQPGWICWDSWYCKDGFDNQCSSAGDKKCHKQCDDHQDCPESMPECKETPIFKGSDRGVLESFCIKE
jgi:hypothetical protein